MHCRILVICSLGRRGCTECTGASEPLGPSARRGWNEIRNLPPPNSSNLGWFFAHISSHSCLNLAGMGAVACFLGGGGQFLELSEKVKKHRKWVITVSFIPNNPHLPYKHRPPFWTKIWESNYNAINTTPLFQIKKSSNTLKSNDSEKKREFLAKPVKHPPCFFDLQIVRGGGV